MARRPTPKANETAHLTVRCINEEFFFRLKYNLSPIVSWLNCLPYFYNVTIHHALIMSNHFHMLVTPKENNLGEAMSYCLTNLSKYLNYFHKRKNHVFVNHYGPTIINNEKHLINVIRYIYQNPVRANMVNKVIKYPYSTLGQYLGGSNLGLKIEPDEYTFQLFQEGFVGRDIWLQDINRLYTENDIVILRKALRKKEFRFTREQLKSISDDKTNIY